MTPHELREAAAAMNTILESGRCADLDDRLAAAHQAERERRNARSIGHSLNLEIELKRALFISTEEAKTAANQLLDRTKTDIAFEALLAFAAEISSPPRRREPESRVGDPEELRRTWNPYNGGLTWEEQHESAPPPEKRPTPRKRRGPVA